MPNGFLAIVLPAQRCDRAGWKREPKRLAARADGEGISDEKLQQSPANTNFIAALQSGASNLPTVNVSSIQAIAINNDKPVLTGFHPAVEGGHPVVVQGNGIGRIASKGKTLWR